MKMIKTLLIALSLCMPAFADEGFIGMGLGAFNTAKDGPGSVKMGQFGHRLDLIEGFYWQNKVGGWGQGGNKYGMKSSGYVASGIGFRIDLQPIEFRSGYSVAGITHTDSYLGGHFQFDGELYTGLRDRHGNGIGLKYEHVSSAGLAMPNIGRDFFILELSRRW